ncbi:hypothetical protein EVAR_32185_1 [Eumeta japonica]|uniref:Uncharacterized protein n=1 Tax=Eumeta variegata TaxID=151549 RepID=A0A4C1VZE3_EUMVA|nr:hypothetical protein EVAR_32185_1 [Eumeta japonica]
MNSRQRSSTNSSSRTRRNKMLTACSHYEVETAKRDVWVDIGEGTTALAFLCYFNGLSISFPTAVRYVLAPLTSVVADATATLEPTT